MLNIIEQRYADVQISAFLTALEMRGVTVDELLGLREGLLETGRRVDLSPFEPIDIVGTGGALTRLPHREALIRALADCNTAKMMLYPREGELALLFDDDYIMASLGVLSKHYPEAALALMKRSLSLGEREG